MGWYFFPWTAQYLIGSALAFAISFYLISKNPRSKPYQAFFFYGMFTGLWEIFAFLHRNAPTPEISCFWLRADGIVHILLLPFLLLTIIYLTKRENIFLLTIFPAVIGAIILSMFSGIETTMTEFGWSYKTPKGYFALASLMFFGYAIAIIATTLSIYKKHRIHALQKKLFLILAGFISFQLVGMVFTNLLLMVSPNSPPFGGFLSLLTFLFIAYAISLPTGEITIPPGKPLEILAGDWLKFLRKLREVVPGRELGEDITRFEDALRAMGLNEVIRTRNGELIFNGEQLASLGVNELVDDATDFMRKQDWALKAIKEYTDVFINIYKTNSKRDKNAAAEWFDTMVRKYGGFLDKQGVLDAMPKDAKIPGIFKELRERKTYLFKEERPTKAYEKLKEALKHGFECLVVSKLEPKKVEERYGISKASIFWLTFKEAENTINPQKLWEVKGVAAEFLRCSSRAIVLLDCFDQLMLANGFEKAESLLREVKDICIKNNTNLLLSVNPEMFDEKQLTTIEKELEEVKL